MATGIEYNFTMRMVFNMSLILLLIVLTARVSQADEEEEEENQTCYYAYRDRYGRYHYVHCQFGCCDSQKIECCPDPDAGKVSVISKDNTAWLIALGVVAGVLVLTTLACCIFASYKHKMMKKMTVRDSSGRGGESIGMSDITRGRGRDNPTYSDLNYLASISAPPAYSKDIQGRNTLPPIDRRAPVTQETEQPPPYSVAATTPGNMAPNNAPLSTHFSGGPTP